MIGLTLEELRLLKSFILLPIVMSIFERDKRVFEKEFKTPGPYLRMIEAAMDRATKDLAQVRRDMRKARIKVYEEERTEKAAECMTACRGYQQKHTFLWDRLKSETEARMRYYLGEDVDVDNV